MNKFRFATLIVALVSTICLFTSCLSMEVAQYGLEGDDTIALNLTKDPNVGALFVTHVNGEATGGYIKEGFMGLGLGGGSKYINPLYVKLNGKPIVFTILCPVVTGQDHNNKPIVVYKSTELRLTKLADLKAGDVLTLKWMYQTQTFAFMDATGNIVQQTIPTFN